MDPAPPLETLARLAEQLVDCPDERRRERLLLDAVRTLGWARAAALFRPGGPEPEATWREVLARGPAELLVDADQVSAMAEGALPRELPLGRQVLFAGEGAEAAALALGGLEASEESVDRLEALLHLLLAVSEADPGRSPAPLDRWHPPLPAEEERDPPPRSGLSEPARPRDPRRSALRDGTAADSPDPDLSSSPPASCQLPTFSRVSSLSLPDRLETGVRGGR